MKDIKQPIRGVISMKWPIKVMKGMKFAMMNSECQKSNTTVVSLKLLSLSSLVTVASWVQIPAVPLVVESIKL